MSVEDLEQANARIAELEGQVTSLAGERDGAVTLGQTLQTQLAETAAQRDAAAVERESVAAQVGELTTARDGLAATVAQAQAAALEATRRAILAENAGQLVPELVAGESIEALTASVETARAAQTRATEAARAAIAGQTVPAGAGSARTVTGAEGLSPMEMISAGLSTGKAGR